MSIHVEKLCLNYYLYKETSFSGSHFFLHMIFLIVFFFFVFFFFLFELSVSLCLLLHSLILQTPGKEEYLIADVHLSQYMYIREHVCQDQFSPIPLVIVHRGTIQGECYCFRKQFTDGSVKTTIRYLSFLVLLII